ncbi:MAG: restriction endonuclease [Candidatus Moduliflexus flocculans]|nr:restriction endonuclease [Candidatus Moduliflexus flocculans]
MGYGGSRAADGGKAIAMSGDGGIDGIIKEDKLGLDVVYIQAKRWDNNPYVLMSCSLQEHSRLKEQTRAGAGLVSQLPG